MLDAKNNLLVVDDQLFDISKDEFRKIQPADCITKTCKRNAPIEEQLEKQKYIKEILFSIFENQDVVDYWFKIIGVGLFTNKYENFYILTGKGGNGKGLLFEVLKNCIGEYYYQAENTFLAGITKSGAANPTLANCKGVRLLSVSEPNNGTETCALNCDFIKSMTGRDDITSRNLYQTNITYTPQFNVFLQCNDMPSIKKLDNGMTRRIRVINYPFQFVESPINSTDRKVNIKLKDDFKNDELLKDAFLQILIRYATENINSNNIDQPEQVKESMGNYFEENNPIKAFLNEHYDITNSNRDKILCSDVVKAVNTEFSEKSSAVKIKKDMAFNGFEQHKIMGSIYYCGLVEKPFENVFDDQSDNPLDG